MLRCPACGSPHPDDATHCAQDGTLLPRPAPSAEALVGTIVGARYRVTGLLGQGGMGAVYQARHVAMDTDVALKVMHPSVVNPRSVARFVREARAASRVDHENVIGVIDFGQAEEGYYYFVMEHVSGRSLDAEIQRVGAFRVERALRILAQIASGLARAHEIGIAHRDLKPDNVLLCRRQGDPDFVKIIDFGIAKPLTADAGEVVLTQEGEIFGTPEYMSPEQWQGVPVDQRTDIYSFGVLAYELVTGHLVFEGDIRELMVAHLSREPIPPSQRARQPLPPELEVLILRALRKDRELRFQTMAEVRDLLRSIWERMPGHATASLGDVPTLHFAAPDTLPDASTDEGAPFDGPALVDEIQRLHGLRGRRLAELAAALWRTRRPPEVAALVARIDELELSIAREGEAVALLRSRLEEARRSSLAQQAELRGEIFDASVALEHLEDELASQPTLPRVRLPASGEAEARRRVAEERLSAAAQSWSRRVVEAREELARRLGAIRRTENELRPLLDELAAAVRREAEQRPELRPHVRELQRVHRALAAFEGLLASFGDD